MRLQEIKKTRIVIASVLKPVDDTRMFEKLGATLAEYAEVHIIGYASRVVSNHPSIFFHSLQPFNRLSIGRILASWKIFKKVMKIKPDTLIITTHELLVIGVLSKIILSCTLLYDVQENYARNIFYTNAFPKILRPLIAAYVRSKEWIAAPFVNHFLVAERGYEKELKFIRNKKTSIENKVKRMEIVAQKKNDGNIHLLFTGTLAETTGVFKAIELAEQLHKVNSAVRLTIMGYCSQQTTLEKIRKSIHEKNFIQLVGGDYLIPHSEILTAIQSAHFGIIAYAENRSIVNSIPTKLYEYLGYQLPILMVDYKPWNEITKRYSASIPFNIAQLNPEETLHQMKNKSFYVLSPQDVFWESEAEKLLKIVFDN